MALSGIPSSMLRLAEQLRQQSVAATPTPPPGVSSSTGGTGSEASEESRKPLPRPAPTPTQDRFGQAEASATPQPQQRGDTRRRSKDELFAPRSQSAAKPEPAPTAGTAATPRPGQALGEPDPWCGMGSIRRETQPPAPPGVPEKPEDRSPWPAIPGLGAAGELAKAAGGALVKAGEVALTKAAAAAVAAVGAAAVATVGAGTVKLAKDGLGSLVPSVPEPPAPPASREQKTEAPTPAPRRERTPAADPTRRPDPTRTPTPESTATAAVTQTPTSTSTPTPTPTNGPTASLAQATPSLEARDPTVDALQRLDHHALETIDSTVGRDRFVGLVSEVRAIDRIEPRMVDEIDAYFKRMHAENPDLGYDSKANTAMIRRLREAASGGHVTPTDLEFLRHELLELRLTQHGVPKGYTDRPDGMIWDPAHDLTIESLGQKGMKLYHPNAVKEATASGEDWWQGY